MDELTFMKECDKLCSGDVLLGEDRDKKVRNFLTLSAMISDRISELEKRQTSTEAQFLSTMLSAVDDLHTCIKDRRDSLLDEIDYHNETQVISHNGD